MQKALRINLLTRNAALKKKHYEELSKLRGDWQQYNQQDLAFKAAWRGFEKEEKKNRREDWIRGPLAPKRDVGSQKGIYGAVTNDALTYPQLPEKVRKSPRALGSDAVENPEDGFKGEGMVGNVMVDDRVVIIRGDPRWKGKIGRVSSIQLDKETVKLSGMLMADYEIPDYAPQYTEVQQKLASEDIDIPMNDIRLVIREPDPVTGIERDVIVKHVYAAGPYRQEQYGTSIPQHKRYIAGEDRLIPWPTTNPMQDLRRQVADTPRLQVDQARFTPSVVYAPLLSEEFTGQDSGLIKRHTESIMDELQDKTRKDNTRHVDKEYLRRRLLQDARSIWWLDRNKRITKLPAAERAELEANKRRQKEQEDFEANAQYGGVTKETLDIIQQMQSVTLTDSARLNLAKEAEAIDGEKSKPKRPQPKMRLKLIIERRDKKRRRQKKMG